MNTLHKPLYALTAEDIMSRDVQLIPAEMSMAAAAGLLAREHISGAPVVDPDGHCVGVLTATDFVRLAEKNHKAEEHSRAARTVFASEWEVINGGGIPVDEVRSQMSSDVVTVGPQTRLKELARQMIDAHIHRVIVVDAEGHPVGIITSTDVLAAVAYAGGPTEEE